MRFYDNDIVPTRPSLAFMPFGAGPHRCFGAAMGYLRQSRALGSFRLKDSQPSDFGRPEGRQLFAQQFRQTAKGGDGDFAGSEAYSRFGLDTGT
jgi:cytochrome P450